MKTYLVTGGAGFIGCNFIRYMLGKYGDIKVINLDALTYAGSLDNLRDVENDARYRFVHGDVCDAVLVPSLFKGENIDIVVNFAAESHVDRSIADPDVFALTNFMGTLNLLNAARAAWLTGDDVYKDGAKFVQISTDEVYGSLGPEGLFTENTPLDPRSPYSASKAAADLMVKAYADTYKMPVNITRCSNNYGPCQYPEKLIPLMIKNALEHKPLPVYGDGLNVRDWLYVDDHCAAIDLVIENGGQGEIYNIGGHNEYPNIEIVKLLLDYMNNNIDSEINESLITYVTDRKGHDRRYAIDPQKIHRELGWLPETKFSDGIVKTVGWYVRRRKHG